MENKSTQPLKGFRDIYGKEALKREWFKNKLVLIFKKWGYEPMETPALEPLSIFEGQIGDDEKFFYKFKDNGGRDVALRYDQTVPTCRVVADKFNELTFPYKRYQIQSAFRAENPQKGRFREFIQCDADIFGSSSVLADAEVIALSLDIYRELGFKDVCVLVNDRELLKDVPYAAISSIDKLEKIGDEGVIEDMKSKGIEESSAKDYLKKVKNLKPNSTINTIFNFLESYGFDSNWYKFEPTLARSFSYSSGPIWEVVAKQYKSSLLGGERYDNLTERVSGRRIPATGFGMGFDRSLETALELGLIPDINDQSDVLVAALNISCVKTALQLVDFTRNNDVKCEIYPDELNDIGKAIKYALKKEIKFIVLVGDDEVKSNTFTVKNLTTKEQKVLNQNELLSFIKNG